MVFEDPRDVLSCCLLLLFLTCTSLKVEPDFVELVGLEPPLVGAKVQDLACQLSIRRKDNWLAKRCNMKRILGPGKHNFAHS